MKNTSGYWKTSWLVYGIAHSTGWRLPSHPIAYAITLMIEYQRKGNVVIVTELEFLPDFVLGALQVSVCNNLLWWSYGREGAFIRRRYFFIESHGRHASFPGASEYPWICSRPSMIPSRVSEINPEMISRYLEPGWITLPYLLGAYWTIVRGIYIWIRRTHFQMSIWVKSGRINLQQAGIRPISRKSPL